MPRHPGPLSPVTRSSSPHSLPGSAASLCSERGNVEPAPRGCVPTPGGCDGGWGTQDQCCPPPLGPEQGASRREEGEGPMLSSLGTELIGNEGLACLRGCCPNARGEERRGESAVPVGLWAVGRGAVRHGIASVPRSGCRRGASILPPPPLSAGPLHVSQCLLVRSSVCTGDSGPRSGPVCPLDG